MNKSGEDVHKRDKQQKTHNNKPAGAKITKNTWKKNKNLTVLLLSTLAE